MEGIMNELKRLQVIEQDYNALKKAFDGLEKTVEKKRELICAANQDLHSQELLIAELREAHRRQGVELSLARSDYDFQGARIAWLERYTDEQAHTILELKWEIHQLKEAANE